MGENTTKTYTVTLADGTTFSGLTQNGSYYVSQTDADDSIFVDNCSPLKISDGEYEEVIDYGTVVDIKHVGGGFMVTFRALTPDELRRIKMQADIEYLAMMSDIEL